MRAVPVAEGIHWVGAIDWDLRDFHGYETPGGTTYNAYLVQGDTGVALVDTVKEAYVPELLARVSDLCDPGDVTHIVVNHLEPDHNGGLRAVMEAMPGARVVASPSGARSVGEYHDGVEVDAVKDDVIDLGGVTLRFQPVPMVHWPDSMFTWCEERSVLMPNDGFGQHHASSERFADELGVELALQEAQTYFANILMPLTKQVGKAIGKVVDLGWQPEVIAPSHGVMWRGPDVGRVIDAYGRWVAGETSPGVVVAFATMWESTRTLAHAVADGVSESGAQAHVFDLAHSSYAEVMRAVMDSRTILLGSPTLHHGMLHNVAGFLQYMAGLHPVDMRGGVFGSFGWGGGACKEMSERLEAIGLDMPFQEYTVKFRPTEADIAGARAWGREIGAQALQDPVAG